MFAMMHSPYHCTNGYLAKNLSRVGSRMPVVPVTLPGADDARRG